MGGVHIEIGEVRIVGLETVVAAVDNLVGRVGSLEAKVDALMANVDDLRALQAQGTAALDQLGTTIQTEAAQVAAILADLVAATGNQVTEADVAAAQDHLARIEAAGVAVSGIAPDAPTEPPVG